MRYWTSYWREKSWLRNEEYAPLQASGGSFQQRGISIGDAVYVLSLRAGQLLLGGRILVERIVTRQEAVRILKRTNLHDADDWIIAKSGSGTLLHQHRQLLPEVSRQLQFVSGRSRLLFTNANDLDGQTLRVPRELSEPSAYLLDDIIEMTEGHGRTNTPITISADQLQRHRLEREVALGLHEEIWNGRPYPEGSVKQVLVNSYERDPNARTACIKKYGTTCSVCGVDLTVVYGRIATGFIHVHHLCQLSEVGSDYSVDPIRDLRPVCPNCHAIIHLRLAPYSIDEVKGFVASPSAVRD
jgi:hypothetical protein